MIKGVTKNIIVVNNPDSLYFERAVFYLKPDISSLPPEFMENETERCISELRKKYRTQKYTHLIYRISLCSLLFVSAGIIIYTLIK